MQAAIESQKGIKDKKPALAREAAGQRWCAPFALFYNILIILLITTSRHICCLHLIQVTYDTTGQEQIVWLTGCTTKSIWESHSDIGLVRRCCDSFSRGVK